jgi:hypothetical protein
MSLFALCATCIAFVIKRDSLGFVFNSCQDCLFTITINYFFGVFCLNYCELRLAIVCCPIYIATYVVMEVFESNEI